LRLSKIEGEKVSKEKSKRDKLLIELWKRLPTSVAVPVEQFCFLQRRQKAGVDDLWPCFGKGFQYDMQTLYSKDFFFDIELQGKLT
jgi:hypothetical protein